MRISTCEISRVLNKWQTVLEDHLPPRICDVLEEIQDKDLSKNKEMCLFDFTVRIIMTADKEPAQHIAELLMPINEKNIYDLGESTIQQSAAFIRDYLKKDSVIYSLENKEEQEPLEGSENLRDSED